MIDGGAVMLGLFAAGFAGALALRFGFTRERRIKRALKRVRPRLVRDVRDGKVVKLVGELAYAAQPLTAPLSGRTCAFYSILVEEYRSRGTRGGHWYEVLREERGVDFFVRDESGVALVRPGGGQALPALVQDRKARSSPILHSDADLERFLAERGRSAEGFFFRKNLRAFEGVLEAGERVAVGGLARWVADPDAAGGGYREAGRRLVLQSSESLPLLFSDDPAAW